MTKFPKYCENYNIDVFCFTNVEFGTRYGRVAENQKWNGRMLMINGLDYMYT